MIKILKSFQSAYDAINWVRRSEIENFIIESTSSLKSVGHNGYIPPGNYHVVLKKFRTRAESGEIDFDAIRAAAADEVSDIANRNKDLLPRKRLEEIHSKPALIRKLAESMGVRSFPKHAAQDAEAMERASREAGVPEDEAVGRGLLTAAPAVKRRGKRIEALARGAEERANQNMVTQSISREDLVDLITKSVIEKLRLK
jgi:hypothetical protein